MPRFFEPDLLFTGGRFSRGRGLLVNDRGVIEGVYAAEDARVRGAAAIRLRGRALLPGMVNAHSHSFQRLIRGRSENRKENGDTFWTWREAMYRAAETLSPEEVCAVARVTFLEMLRAGITTVGEFHYVHRAPDGSAYPDGNLLARQVIAAAEEVGIRIVLLRSAYFRAGYARPPHAGQRRFYEEPEEYLANAGALYAELKKSGRGTLGLAPHSIRAVPLDQLRGIAAWATARELPLHMHAAEQRGELRACEAEYGTTPVALLAQEGLLSDRTVLVHAIHISEAELEALAAAEATICSCPTTERNLGDGVFDARRAAMAGVRIAFGTDSQAQIDLLEDARALDYHQRLLTEERALLDGIDGIGMAERVFRYATCGGAEALGFNGGELAAGLPADFFAVDLDDPSIAGADEHDLLPLIVFGAAKSAIREVAVGGEIVVRNGEHHRQREALAAYRKIRERVWSQG